MHTHGFAKLPYPLASGSSCHFSLPTKQLRPGPHYSEKHPLPGTPGGSPRLPVMLPSSRARSRHRRLELPLLCPLSFHMPLTCGPCGHQISARNTGAGKNSLMFPKTGWPFCVHRVHLLLCFGLLSSLPSSRSISEPSQLHSPAFSHPASGVSREQGSNVISGRTI